MRGGGALDTSALSRPPRVARRLHPAATAALLLGGLLAFAPANLSAQELLGRVIDRASGQPIPDVEIRALRGDTVVARTTSNEIGGFRLVLPAGGRYWLEASRMNYVQLDTVSLEVPPDGRRVIDFILDPVPITLEEIRAEVRRGVPARFLETYEGFLARHEQLPKAGSRRVVRRGDPEMQNAGTVQEVLNWLPPARASTLWFLDGRPSTEEEIEGLIFDDVEGVEFYRSDLDAPIFVDSRGQTSVVMVWRRRGPGD
jgi:hypothetical protein